MKKKKTSEIPIYRYILHFLPFVGMKFEFEFSENQGITDLCEISR